MTSFRVGDATRADQELYTHARMVEVSCGTCGTVVGVKKNSDQHTSIQWGEDGVSTCREFAESAARPGGRAVYAPCPRLALSIDAAVDAGRIEIGAIDGY
ncbi:hypothetical protein Back2_27920 [Nocardioides baekrokdamisoli]|uniref:Ferredoxin n=1 Tax=Nocardioides baekrokdamisoli TaxID=1804624 RepID=A0A3G9IRA5_9ACTN|nr:hypothetical protein [Nocardioides baekrokdamisoli]BBH18505.1 hypothetical protein Back2_27920 [Nocardioides baekrokdamisoli]